MNDFVELIEPKYKLAICELYHPYFHGDLNDEDNKVKNYLYNSYLCAYTIEEDELYDLYPWRSHERPWGLPLERSWPDVKHPSIRNYHNIVKKYALEIVQMIHINTGHQMCIPKTFWLKIIQRKYKNHYKKIQERIRRTKHPKALLQRQITGKRF